MPSLFRGRLPIGGHALCLRSWDTFKNSDEPEELDLTELLELLGTVCAVKVRLLFKCR